MREVNPLRIPEYLKYVNPLGVSPDCTRAELWIAAQSFTLFWCNFCLDRGLPPEAVASVFGVYRECESHYEAALYGAKNLVETYLAPDFERDPSHD